MKSVLFLIAIATVVTAHADTMKLSKMREPESPSSQHETPNYFCHAYGLPGGPRVPGMYATGFSTSYRVSAADASDAVRRADSLLRVDPFISGPSLSKMIADGQYEIECRSLVAVPTGGN